MHAGFGDRYMQHNRRTVSDDRYMQDNSRTVSGDRYPYKKLGLFPLTDMQTKKVTEVVTSRSGYKWSVLNRTETIIKNFSDFYFSSYYRKLG